MYLLGQLLSEHFVPFRPALYRIILLWTVVNNYLEQINDDDDDEEDDEVNTRAALSGSRLHCQLPHSLANARESSSVVYSRSSLHGVA